MSTHTHIYNRLTTPILRLALLLMMIIGGMTEVGGQESKYIINKVVNGNIVGSSTVSTLDKIWETDFSEVPAGFTYSVTNGDTDISSGVLHYNQGGGTGGRAINSAFVDEKFHVTDANWVLEFDWGASSSSQGNVGSNTSSVTFATNKSDAFTLTWEALASTATITDASGRELTTTLPIDGSDVTNMVVLSHFTIIGNRNGGIYLTVTYNGIKYVNNVLVTSTFGYPATFNGTLGRAYSHMALDNIEFATYTAPYPYYIEVGGRLYYHAATNKGYDYPIPWQDSKNGTINIEYIESAITDVVYLKEAEEISGMTLCTSSNSYVRSSNGASAYAATGNVELTKLTKGSYLLTAVVFDASTSPNSFWKFYANDEEFANLHCTTINFQELISYAFDVEQDNTAIYLGQGGDANKGIDLIYIRRISTSPLKVLKWTDNEGQQSVVKSVIVDIADIDDNNQIASMPKTLLNTTYRAKTRSADSQYIVYSAKDNTNEAKDEFVKVYDTTDPLPRIKSIGESTIYATNTQYTFEGKNIDVATYTLTITGATGVTGDYDKATNTYTFNTIGQAANANTIDIEGIKMSYGFDDGNGRHTTAVVVKNETVGPILKIIDANGFSHPNLGGGVVANIIPAADEYGGTYYKFTTSISGTLTIVGQLNNATIYKYNGTGDTPVLLTGSNNGTSITVDLNRDNTYYLYNSGNATPLLHSFRYVPAYSVMKYDYENKINVVGTPSIDGFAFHKNVKLIPIITVVDNKTGAVLDPSAYQVKYNISNNDYVNLNSVNGVLTTKEITNDGTVTISTIVEVGGETIPLTYTLMVLTGMWDFTQYNSYRHGQLKTKGYDNGIYDNDPDVWSDNSGNIYPKARDTKGFEYILCGGENANEPLDIARALQSANSVRWMRQNSGYFYMFGYSSSTYGRGGILKVPVRKGMVIEINGYSDSEHAEMLINNDGNLMHTETEGYSAVSEFDRTPVTTFFIEPQAASYRYLVTNPSKDGFVYIVNSSANLPFMINWIKLTTELLFKYGTETYTEAGTPFKNQVINGDENNTFTYRLINGNASIDDDGNVTAYGSGTYTVEVTAHDGDLDGVKGTYTVHVINMTSTTPVEAIAQDDLEWNAEDLKALITIEGLSGDDLTNAINRVEFSEKEEKRDGNIRRVTISGDVGNQSLVIDGVGEVVILAKLGSIEREITFVIKGGALADKSPVYPNTATSADIVVVGKGIGNIQFESEWMLENLLGDLANYKNPGRADELILTPKDDNTLTLSRKDGSPFAYGGAMPIRGTFVYNGATYNLTGMLTISYTSNSWKFDSNMLVNNHPTYQGVYNFYTDTTKDTEIQKRLGEWTTNATFDEPTDDPVIPDASQRHWKFIRKMGSNNPNTDIIYAYLSSVDGDNAMIMPRSAGLIVNSSKGSDQFGVQMLTTRVGVKKIELGLPNMVGIDGVDTSPKTTTVTKDDFKLWDYYDFGASFSETIPNDYGFNSKMTSLSAGDVVFGTKLYNEVDPVHYMVFASLPFHAAKLVVTGTPDLELLVYLNCQQGRTGTDVDAIEEYRGTVEKKTVKIGADGTGELDLSSFYYSHINAIKVVSGSGEIGKIEVVTPTVLGYNLQNMMFKVGGELTIPYVKPGQWVEMRWYRHTPDRGERMRLTNLCDVEGTPIKKTFRIGNTQQGTYMFQVGSHDGMVDEEQGYVNATFHIDDNTFISIQEVILHEPGWVYNSSMGNCLMQTGDDPEVQNQYITDGTERKFEFATHESHNAPTAPCDWQIKVYGDLDYTISDGRATNHLGYIRPEQFMPEKEAYIIVRDGWGKVYVTLNSYTSDYKYVVNRKTWTITFGVPPVQNYPYTWDFTKYYAATKTALGGDYYEDLPVQDDTTNGTEDENTDSGLEIVPREDEVDDDDYHDPEYYEDFDYIVGITDSYDETDNPTGSREFLVQINTWNESDVEETVITTDYDSVKYGSFFVDGAQLVSLGLKEPGSKGILPETAGLGFRVKNLGDKINDNVGILQLDMQSIVDGTETETDDGKAKDGATWRSGKLAIRGGGSIIVPRPDESEDKDYYIYIRCSAAPDTVRNAVRMIAKATDENDEDITDNGINSVSEDNSEAIPVKETRDENYDVDESKGLYKYRFQKNDAGEYVGDVELKFNRDADIYVLGVTNIMKKMTAYNGAGWATESRDHEIDHTLTGYLTTNAAKAYAVLETDGNPAYSGNKAQTVVALKDTCHVAPAEYGLVMKQADVIKKDGEAYEDGETYTVPLFYPAITTSTDDVSASLFNLMRPNVTAKELSGETEEIDGDEYTRFILASRYLTWKRDEDGTLNKPNGYEEDPVVAFYRLHVFDKGETIDSNDDNNDATTLNTMPANSAYLLLRSDMINDALWNDDSKSIKELFIGIEGVSDMILAEYLEEQEDIIDAMPDAPVEIYNLRGQKLNANSQLEPGIYIMNGKKILIRKHNGQ